MRVVLWDGANQRYTILLRWMYKANLCSEAQESLHFAFVGRPMRTIQNFNGLVDFCQGLSILKNGCPTEEEKTITYFSDFNLPSSMFLPHSWYYSCFIHSEKIVLWLRSTICKMQNMFGVSSGYNVHTTPHYLGFRKHSLWSKHCCMVLFSWEKQSHLPNHMSTKQQNSEKNRRHLTLGSRNVPWHADAHTHSWRLEQVTADNLVSITLNADIIQD